MLLTPGLLAAQQVASDCAVAGCERLAVAGRPHQSRRSSRGCGQPGDQKQAAAIPDDSSPECPGCPNRNWAGGGRHNRGQRHLHPHQPCVQAERTLRVPGHAADVVGQPEERLCLRRQQLPDQPVRAPVPGRPLFQLRPRERAELLGVVGARGAGQLHLGVLRRNEPRFDQRLLLHDDGRHGDRRNPASHGHAGARHHRHREPDRARGGRDGHRPGRRLLPHHPRRVGQGPRESA